ncbi:ulp1 protease family, C-terminal catalytic domain protein [Rickettsia felis str. Pedreira]|uniref:Ulp1 protease family, C-terminal catalytic domain protein n=1 Tax=Rickettsia felis str. Pedreira TaxID=1359196 RepID=A0A0F3MU71_RICFI|nr:ulp1 protease family, C-terminal catalytic domain protein [Rickettsia felis str. Pedreira]
MDNCGINDKQVKILAEIFRLNKTITKLSLVSNKAITNIGIKTLLEIKHNNQYKRAELEISPNFNDNSEFQLIPEIDILNKNSVNTYLKKTKARNLDSEIENKNLQPLKNYHELKRPFIKNGNKLLKLIAESHNEITKTGNSINKLIVMVGMNGVGATTLSCFLSGQKLEEDEDRSLYAKEPKYNEKIHHQANNGYKLVNNFFISDDEGGINIIECPGIHNKPINSIQTILNLYIYRQILELAEKVRFSVVIRDNSANDVVDSTYQQFTNIFRDSNGQLTPEIKEQLKDAVSYIISVADYKTNEEKKAKIKVEESKLRKDAKRQNLDEGQKFIIEELGKSVNLFKKPSGDTKSFLETLDTKDFFIVIDAISLVVRTIANNEIEAEREQIFSYIEAIFQSKNEEEKNANIVLIDEWQRKILDVLAISKDTGDVLPKSASVNFATTIEVISQSKNEEEKNTNITVIDGQKHPDLYVLAPSKGTGDVLPNSASNTNSTITAEEQKNIMTTALKFELQDILSKKNLYEPLIIEQVKKLMSLCIKPFSDTLNIKDLSQAKDLNQVKNLNQVKDSSQNKWATIKEIYIKPQKSETQKPILSQVLSNQVKENILTIGKIIINFFQVNKHNIISPFISSDNLNLHQGLDSDTFSNNYSLIQPYLPKKILNKSPAQETEESFFPALKEIEELNEIYIKYSDDHLTMVTSFLEIIRKFYESKDISAKIHFQEILGNYVYFLNQQWKALSFCKKLYPQSQKWQPLTEAVDKAKKILIEENLLDIKLKNNGTTKYYTEALEWLDKLTGPQVEVVVIAINEIKANAYYYLGMIYENSESQLDWFVAIREYIKTLEVDKDFNFLYGHDTIPYISSNICKKIGDLFLVLGKWYKSKNENVSAIKLTHEAMKYFKVSLSIADIEESSNILHEIFSILKNKRETKVLCISLEKDLHISVAEFLFQLNLIQKAGLEYLRAASRVDKNDKEKQGLVSKALKAFDTDIAKNTAFIRAMLEKGKIEDLSMFTKEVNRTKFFSDTQTLVNNFVPLPEPQAIEWPKVQQNQNEQLTNEQKETNKQNDIQPQKQEEVLVQLQQTQQHQPPPLPPENSPLHTVENIQKPDYWYTEDDIKNILEANIDKNKFSIVTHVDLAHPEQVRDALRERVHEDLIKNNKIVLMAINTGHGHWVSMAISKDNNTNKVIFKYNDPLGRELNDRPDLIELITEVCSEVEIIDLQILQQDNTSDCGVFVCDDLIRQSQSLEILSTEQCGKQGLNLRKSQAETLKQSLIAQQAQEQHVYINVDSNASDDEEDENNNGNNNEVARLPYGDNGEVDGLGIASQHNE